MYACHSTISISLLSLFSLFCYFDSFPTPTLSLTTFFWIRVFSPTTHSFVSCSATTTYMCWLCHSPLPDKEDYFVCLFIVAFLSTTMWVFSLAIPHGIHLVIPTHPTFFWVVCHPTRTSPQKNLSRNPRIDFPFSPPPDHTLSYL